ncbi:uncharacterized protein LALA0_S03e00430g [Lachancea lanzarotensis]|uniref:LALA0S03e00430g1_1 n=1 Tax=Lachancea lanzarotensis TaxID=1245769 RepID=A0A0C7N059_9SACH|nr:uncharacterized protein LALA0_S03e00430g [Lachancea lanzarotensis]CEP61329.1 LALA0S03e00430g1_1 [Lachancea lanzarotensis]
MSTTSLQKSRKRTSLSGLKAVFKRNPSNQGKAVKKQPVQEKSFLWRPWGKRYAKQAPINQKKLRALYNVDISVAVAIVICFGLAVMLLIVKEIGLTARHCVKWDMWTILATGQRNSVVRIVQRVAYKLWEGSLTLF